MTSRRLHQNAWKTWVFSALGLCLGALPVHAATITWKAAVNGSWSLATNWMPAQVPGSGDIAVITTSGNYDVNINGNVNVGAINLGSAARLRVNGVTLTTTTGIAVGSAATLELNSGTLSGGGVSLNGQLSSTGTSTVNVGLTTATSSTITVGAGTLTVADGFTNRGLLSYPASGTRNFYVTSGTLINASTGTISSATTSSLSAELINQGSITVTAQRLDIVKSGVAHANTGSISVSGSASVLAFDLSGSTLNTSGSISVNSGCYLSVADGAF
ncbi:MAG TPA: hypothetical protein VFP10_03265, partial [Candidatus Eisenbacteria bacterium]|nr:hypothetical protein [Candidatus Eisenbacteria bacterium]